MVGLLGSLLSNQRRMHRRRSSASLRSRIGPGSVLCGRDIPGGALTGGTSSARAGTALSITVPTGSGTGAGDGGISGVVVCTTSGSSANNCRRREKSGARSPNVSRAHTCRRSALSCASRNAASGNAPRASRSASCWRTDSGASASAGRGADNARSTSRTCRRRAALFDSVIPRMSAITPS